MEKNKASFEKKIKQNIVDPSRRQMGTGNYGVVLSYSSKFHTATVMMAAQDSHQQGQVLTNVVCPTNIGVQMQAPEAGRPCWVQFRNGGTDFPIITNFFNHAYREFDYDKQTNVDNPVPSYMLEM